MSSICSPNRSSGVDSRTWLNTLQGCCWNEPSCLSSFRCTNNVTQTGHRRFNSRYFYAHVAQSSVTVLLNSVSTSDFSHWFIWQCKNGVNVFSISLLCHVCIHSCPCSVVTFKQGSGLVKINHMWLCHSHLMVQPVFCVDFWWLRLYIPFGSNDSGGVSGTPLVTICAADCGWHWHRFTRWAPSPFVSCSCDLEQSLWFGLWVWLVCICQLFHSNMTLIFIFCALPPNVSCLWFSCACTSPPLSYDLTSWNSLLSWWLVLCHCFVHVCVVLQIICNIFYLIDGIWLLSVGFFSLPLYRGEMIPPLTLAYL